MSDKRKTDSNPETLELAPQERQELQERPSLHPLAILERAIRGGVTKENIEVAKELLQMAREQRAEDAKAAFAKAFLQLRKNMPEIYADREAKNDGKLVYTYCSEEEIAKKLEPHLLTYGFTMLPGQTMEGGLITVNVTLIHEAGHAETRGYTVHPGTSNKMKDMTACDTGAATAAWRHLMIKMFGLKSRIRESDDAKNVGENITPAQAKDLQRRLSETAADVIAFLDFAGIKLPPTASADDIAKAFDRIPSSKLGQLDAALRRKEKTSA